MRLARRPAIVLFALLLALLSLPPLACADTPPAPAHGNIPFKQETQSTDTLAWQSMAGVILAGLAAYGIVFGLKRYGGNFGGKLGGPLRRGRRVQTLEVIRLSRRSTLYVVEYDGRELLLAESEHGIQLVSGHAAEPPKLQGKTDA